MNKQAKALQEEIDAIFKNMHIELDELDAQNMAAIDQRESEINNTINEIRKVMNNLNRLSDSNCIYDVSEYKSRNEEFWRLPAKYQVTQPTYTPPQAIDREQICQHIGFLYPTQRVAEGIMFLTRPSVSQSVSQSCFSC